VTDQQLDDCKTVSPYAREYPTLAPLSLEQDPANYDAIDVRMSRLNKISLESPKIKVSMSDVESCS
jgi:hypothetical protein